MWTDCKVFWHFLSVLHWVTSLSLGSEFTAMYILHKAYGHSHLIAVPTNATWNSSVKSPD